VKHCVNISPTPTPGFFINCFLQIRTCKIDSPEVNLFVINCFLQISKCKIDSLEVNLSNQIVCVLKRHIVSEKRERREAYSAPNLATSLASIVTKTLVYDTHFMKSMFGQF